MSASQSPPASPRTDELDLVALVRTLWAHKLTLLFFTAIAGVLAILYIFAIATPRYAASVYIDAPFRHNLSALNQGRTPAGLEIYTPGQVFEYFTRRLGSDEAFQRYLQLTLESPSGLPASEIEANQWRIAVHQPASRIRNLYQVTIQDHSSQAAHDGLIRYLSLVREQAANTLIDDIKQNVVLSTRNIQRNIDEQIQVARAKREDRILRLTEALSVAQSIGQQEPQLTLATPPSQDSLRPYLDGSELYARGVQALQAELDVLKNRNDDTPFITNLRDEQAMLRLLKEIDISLDNVHLFRFDGDIVQPETQLHPNTQAVLLGAILLGLLCGCCYVWIRSSLDHSA